jgi:low affinity Fe/Cu permease
MREEASPDDEASSLPARRSTIEAVGFLCSGRAAMNEVFRRAAHHTSILVGSPPAFLFALLVVIVWGATGPVFNFSDTWQLVINTGTTIVTFLMVFLIQNTQNRDSRAIHVKLDELILYTRDADNSLVEIDSLSDEQVGRLEDHLKDLAQMLGKSVTDDLD